MVVSSVYEQSFAFVHFSMSDMYGYGRLNFRDVLHCLEQVEEETSVTKKYIERAESPGLCFVNDIRLEF